MSEAKRDFMEEEKKMLDALGNCEFFEGLDPTALEAIRSLCELRYYDRGESLFQQGDFGEHLYIIAEGRVFLERSIDLGSRKGTVTLETLGKGRVLGCWSTLLGESHNLMSSAVCEQPTQILIMKGADLRGIMLSNKELGFNIMEKFCFLLRNRIEAAYGAMERI